MITAQKYYYNGSTFLFSCSDGKVMDDEGAEWVSEWYRGNRYFRRMGSTKRISAKTVKKECKPCNVIL